MKKWYKYFPNRDSKEDLSLPIDRDFGEHEKAMGGYGDDVSYRSREDFFRHYYYGFHYGRLECYDDFIRKNLNKNQSILSLAGGRCANELLLLQDGYRIVCSDLKVNDSYESTKKLFPNFSFLEFDVLKDEPPGIFDAVIVLSLIYLFDDAELERFFVKISNMLNRGGYLVLDSAGPPDNGFVSFYHDFYLRYEMMLYLKVKSMKEKRRHGLVTKHTGFLRSDDEIRSCARKAGFVDLEDYRRYAFLTEFRRSMIFNRFIRNGSSLERLFGLIGRRAPYIRMFCFKKSV